MRYKKKKWQIVSAALAAMMAMQLCIPSATFAAVSTKKLKLITGFTELPEEVAHIQIPADAGENFEDYLNFPETIEASVVEYKNVNHQKNNADRDKGAEDEKAAADDRDKKEDSEIAAGSNAKKENLNEEETPETETSENVPDSNNEEETPETENSENMPDSNDEEETPETENSENVPDSNDEEETPETETSENVPDSNDEEETPETENSENVPDSNDEEETPETENSENVPDSNDEEEADKQEVQEKDQQKDQQGTFLIATDSNGGDFLEDYEFEDEEISEDIPVLTDISVTWELDENREDESGFYYYLPVLPREYILAAGVELPEIEVSMDGGIALLASTDTYNIADGGISINSNTLEQYKDATITGSSTTNVILVSGVDATITISNLNIQIPIDKNDETASTWIPAIRLGNGANLNLILEGKNTLKGGDMCAAIDVPEGCTLTISGEGSLKATGGEGAGIGASSRRNGSLGTIVIDGGDIKAYGGEMAAGIGGSAEGGSGTIIINNGTVYAKGGHGSYYKDIKNVYGGAGIGGGANGCVDKIEINGGNVTAYGGYVTNAGRHPGAAIGAGGGGAKAVEGRYKYGDIEINGGTVSAIAYNNEVYAIGIAVKPGQVLPEGTLDGSISISDQAVVNLNGGDYFPKSDEFGLKKYTIQGTIADGRLTESSYPVTISVGEITWDAGTMKVSAYQGTLTASNYLKPLTSETQVTVDVTLGENYVYQMEADVADVDDENATITLKTGIPLYETRLKFVSTAITSDQVLQATDITIKQDGEPLINQEGQSAAMVIPSMQISYDEANTGHLTVYLPENEGNTEISVTVPGLNGGNPITASGKTISTTTPNEIEMFYDDTFCRHEYYNADGFCEACGAYQKAIKSGEYYEIYNAGQLFWFAKQFNDSKIPDNSNLKLMRDIEIPDGHNWTSIGDISSNKFFKGNIEGNYHVISGLRPANDPTSYKRGLVARIQDGKVQNLGLVLESGWSYGLCYTAVGANIQNCFVVGTHFLNSSEKGTVTNCLAVSGKLEGTGSTMSNRASFKNCYETTKGTFSSWGGITTLDSEEKLKSGEIAYKLNGEKSEGIWGQVIGTEDYPHFRKYSKTVYYDSATGTYSNNNAASITSATVTDIKTISETKATATLKATGTPGAEVRFLLSSGEDERTLTLDDMFSKGTLLTESSSGNYEYTIQDLAPDTEYHVRLMIKKDGKLSLDVTYVNFQTEKMRQEAPDAADVSINYEQETLENKASCDLEYAASKDAQSWTTIRQGGTVRLTTMLDNINESDGSVPFYIRKKASSSMSASEAVLVANLQRQAIPEESNKPNIDYRKEEITISSSLQYVIVNGTNTSPNWTSAKMGSGSGISITDIISSAHESTVYYRYAASNTDEKFAGKPKSITILKRTAAPAAITEGEVTITGTTITINRTNPENDIEYGYRDADSDGAFTWIDGTEIQGLYPAHGYQVTSRIKAKENAFASERTAPLNVSTKDTLRIVGNGTQKWDAKGTYGVSLAQIPVSLASGYGVYNGANQPVAGTWSWEPENSSSASGIYPNVEDNKAYTVKFTPTDSSASYDRTLTDSVVPEISKYPLNFSVAVEDKTYDGTTNAGISSVTFEGSVTLQKDKDYTVTANFDDASVGSGKNVTATVTLMGQTAKNYSLEQSSFTTTGSIIKAAAPDFVKETALTIVNGHEKTYTVTLPALPKLETPKEYGAPTYELGEIKLNDGYYTSGAKVENGKLTLPIQKNDVKTTGSVGTVTVIIKSTNYEDITLTVNVNATNKLVPTVTAPTANALTYNGAEQALVTAGKTTGGTMLYRLGDSEWSEQIPTAKNAGEYTVWYKVQGNAEYADVAEQNVTVTVAKKAVTVTALDKSAYTGSTAPDLSSPEADKDYKVEGLVGADTLSGTVTLDYAQTLDMSKTGKTAINITGTLSNDNYAITYVSGTLTVSKQSSSGGGSNGSGSNDNTNQPEAPVTGETKPIQPDKNGNAAVDNSSVQSAIDKAKQDAKKNGTTENGIGVTVPITPAAGQTSFNVTIKAQTLDLLVKENVRQFTVATDHLVSVNIGLDTLKQLDTAYAGGDIILRADKVDALRSTEAKATIGTRPAYDLSLVYLSGGKETPIANLNGHTILVRLPYTPAKGEQTGNLYAVYVDDAGKVEWITKSSYNASLKAVVFETGHFSVYGVGYKTFVPAFTDITGHWAADNILFAASRGLLSGTSDTTFSPDTGMTRGMFVTTLGRLAGINPDSYQTGKFTDVKADAYYAPYVNWAAQTGIVEGITATTFAPDTNINREQMAVIMKNYAAKLGYDLPQTLRAVTFADNTQISSWAKDAVKSMQQAGILTGKNENKFDPKGTATRAEVATVLRRFVEIVIDPQAANGWQQNDSGQWNYYRNGESVKGWLSEDQKWYWLDKVTGMMFAGGWKQIDGKWYYFYADGTMAVNTASDR
ncbi:S-layer homology domain-containing protein [Clostridium fessum]|uniref:S-layer homology domain-containing protein n=1 Tax=Clostridium fessum TaxID=2126740 RepID=UPI002E79E6BB|nr:S-layer homology domain-containing protein [Clostridium fessum]